MQRAALYSLGLILLAAMLGGCGGTTGGVGVRREFRVDFSPEQKTQLSSPESTQYRIRQGDVLAVRDMFNEDLRQDSVQILPDGSATFLGVDRFKVAGMTISEVDSILTMSYGQRFRDPTIDVYLTEMAARKVYVLGEVTRPGSYDHEGPGYNVVSAVASAGGYTNMAQQGSVALIRVTKDGYMCRELNLASIRNGDSFDPAILDLQPYDIIFVSRTAIGDFAVFTNTLMGALLKYTDFAVDIKYITSDYIYGR